MKIGKKYYVIFKRLQSTNPAIDNRQLFCIVEDEYIAKDFCEKNYGYEYYEDNFEIEEIRIHGQD